MDKLSKLIILIIYCLWMTISFTHKNVFQLQTCHQTCLRFSKYLAVIGFPNISGFFSIFRKYCNVIQIEGEISNFHKKVFGNLNIKDLGLWKASYKMSLEAVIVSSIQILPKKLMNVHYLVQTETVKYLNLKIIKKLKSNLSGC